jgi:serine/threonine protein kinase
MAPNTLEGKTLGKYRVLEPLGRGGMAQVYRAYHPQLDRYVAIKVLRSDLVGEEEFLSRFSREARSVAGLRHPNIVQVFDFDVEDELYYMVMELMEGDSLKARLNSFRSRGEAMPLNEMLQILVDVLKGLGYAHGQGITHRDIKPANILLTKGGQAVVTDFGIAQIIGGTNYTVSGALMGTLHYMAPEQGMGTHVDGRSDIYSLGVVLYEILTGYPPFDADTPLAILMKHLNDPLPLPHAPAQTIPVPFERIVLKALAKKPEDRYASADAMIQALQEAGAACAQIGHSNLVPVMQPAPLAELVQQEVPQVYSGTARQEIADKQFAADVTDFDLDQRLREESQPGNNTATVPPPVALAASSSLPAEPSTEMSATLDEVVRSAAKLFTTVGGVITDALNSATDEVKQTRTQAGKGALAFEVKLQGDENPYHSINLDVPTDDAALAMRAGQSDLDLDSEEIEVAPRRVAQAAVLGGSVLVGANLLAVALGTSTGWWGLYQYGWAGELVLVSFLLFLLMSALAQIWLLIPAGILFGNGVLLSFFAITGNWGLWRFFWPIEPILVGGCIFTALYLARNLPQQGRRLARAFGFVMSMVAGAMLLLIGLGSLVATAIHSLFP